MNFLYVSAFVMLLPIAAYAFYWSARLVVWGMRYYYNWKWHYAEIDRIKKAGNQLSILNPKWSGMPSSAHWIEAIDRKERDWANLVITRRH